MNLREKTSEYLGKKMKERHAVSLDALKGKNDYEQARIDYAKKLLAVTDEYLEIRDKPLTEEERTERSRLTEFRSFAERDDYKRRYEKGEASAVNADAFQKNPAQNAEKKQPEGPQGLALH